MSSFMENYNFRKTLSFPEWLVNSKVITGAYEKASIQASTFLFYVIYEEINTNN